MPDRKTRLWHVSIELVPPRSLVAELEAIKIPLTSGLSLDVVAGTKNYPFHLTLLFTAILHTQAELLAVNVKEVCQRYSPLSLSFPRYTLFPDGSLVLLARRERALTRLHADLVRARQPLGWPAAFRQELTEYFTAEEFSRFVRVADPYALRFFNPHITLARLKDGYSEASIPPPPAWARRVFLFNRVRMRSWTSESGTSRRLASFSLTARAENYARSRYP